MRTWLNVPALRLASPVSRGNETDTQQKYESSVVAHIKSDSEQNKAPPPPSILRSLKIKKDKYELISNRTGETSTVVSREEMVVVMTT